MNGLRDYMLKNPDEYDALKDKDKDWKTVKFGFFILVSNIETSPEEIFQCISEDVT